MSVRDDILQLARDEGADALLELTVSTRRPELYDAAVQEFGSWDAALAHLIEHLLRGRSAASTAPRRASATVEEEVVRKATSSARDPIFTRTTSGELFWIAGEELELTERPEILPTPPDAGPMERMWWIGDPDAVFLFSDQGRTYGLLTRVVPQWMGETPLRPYSDILPHKNSDERPVLVLPRRASYEGRYVHVTREGKGKATEASELGRTLDQTGREAFLVNDGDSPVAMLSTHDGGTIFCASAGGLGIHFEGDELRSMGRKAVGVNVMKLGDERDHIVNAFVGNDVEQLAVITAQGYCKRIDFGDFRTQGRGGGGMQVCKLNAGDAVVGVVPCRASSDLVVTTSSFRVWRTEATSFDSMGRPAKGNRAFDLRGDERIIGLSVLPTSTSNFE